jgi:hypothetical protein
MRTDSPCLYDRNGVRVTVGARVRFWFELRESQIEGTVREVARNRYNDVPEARCDDGDPANPDLRTNGFHVVAIVVARDIEVIDAR